MTDQDGNTYKTVVIGSQEWMAENLTTSIYRNGDPIPTNLNPAQWELTSEGGWSYYNDNQVFSCPYGKFYNWFACVDNRFLCPAGWHVPTDNDWTILSDFLGGSAIAGGQMKTIGTLLEGNGLWSGLNVGATNSCGFGGVPGGFKRIYGDYCCINSDFFGTTTAYYWSSSPTEVGSNNIWIRQLIHNNAALNKNGVEKQMGCSVRCLRD
jgi:uncharacterized protein (TIGR02145 family)